MGNLATVFRWRIHPQALCRRLYSPVRFDENTTLLPSGDQMAVMSEAGSKVKREKEAVAMSTSQMSPDVVLDVFTSIARRLPSGESAGSSYRPGGPSVPSALPRRSNHVSCERLRTSLR